uniref:trypsin n=1 Tax=Cynoglossus semilaevis TaxID=244447 RepID=A0A3P8VWF6_CYNSE
MNLKLLFLCLVLAALLLPAELKPKKDKRNHHDHKDRGDHHRGRGRPRDREHELKREKKKWKVKDIIEVFHIFNDEDDDEEEDEEHEEWLFDLQNPEGRCNPNPCMNNGVCEPKGKNHFKCDCPKHFKGRRCERGPKRCKKQKCGHGECVLTSSPPFYECKCKWPFQPPNCRKISPCETNPCKNGGTCVVDGEDFDCNCPPGYRGQFCHVGPNDCFVDDGESYRGNVSETDDGDECLYWNSHFILDKGTNPFNAFEDSDGLGPHNFCRNPYGESMPWCFFRRRHRLVWDYCDVTECPDPPVITPTPPEPDPTHEKPEPTMPEPTMPVPTAEIEPTTPATMTTKPAVTTKPPTTQAPPTIVLPSDGPTIGPTEGFEIPITTALPQPFATCGKAEPKKITRIFGGLKVSPGAIPWQVSLQVRPKNTHLPYRHVCGGVLISSCWVLTAGHCIIQNKDMLVTMGGLSLDYEEPTEQIHHVEEAIVHEKFNETALAVYNDIALLRLNGTDGVCATESQYVKTACLPTGQLPDGMECTISGWGATENSSYGSNHLLQANVLLINQEKCVDSTVYGKNVDNSMFCAGHLMGGVDSCQGDSGGPLTCKTNNASVVYGLVSWGDKCGKANKPGVYTRVTHFLDWIKSKTQGTFL